MVLSREIADPSGDGRIALFEPRKDLVFLGMVVQFGIDFEIGNDRADHLVIRPVGAIENVEFVLEHGEQPFNVAVLPA